MNRLRKVISLVLIIAVMATITLVGGTLLTPSAAGTGTGLAEHALNAYYSNWSYVYGAMSTGAVDCSGLIYMYSGSGSRVDMMGSSPETGSVYNGIPNIHGLGLYQPGHVGVYVGNDMAVDARSEYYGICYQSASSKNWTNWFKVAGVSYPTDGWEYFNGNYYYYEDGEYLTDTYITVDGVSYYLDSSGASTSTPGDPDSTADSSSGNSSSSSSSSSESKYLKVGSSGDKVTNLQERLTELGFYNSDITGYYGEKTESAYKAFQKAAGLYADGIAGEDELDLLYSDDAPTGSVAQVGTSSSTQNNTNNDTDDTTDTDTESEEVTEEGFTSTITEGDSDYNVFLIQTELTELGYFDEEISGYYGEVTQSAVIKFQAENGLPTTGSVDEATYELLFSERALANPYTEDAGDKKVVYNPNSTEPKEDTTEATVPATVSPTKATDIALQSAEMASKALEGVNLDAKTSSQGNGSFIVWLIVMIAFMSVAFWFVFSSEKKKKKARYERIKARANRSW